MIRYGPDAVLLEFAERPGDEAFARGRALVEIIERDPPNGLREYVPAFTSLLLEFEPGSPGIKETFAEELEVRIQLVLRDGLLERAIKEVPVVYDGPDLERVASANGLAVCEVCQLHSETIYKVYMLGFAPGFPYLGELDPRLHTARLDSPRPRVPPGSVAIGGEHTGIYSVESPGGWNIIGHTKVKMFDPSRCVDGNESTMFFLQPGDRVRFVPMER